MCPQHDLLVPKRALQRHCCGQPGPSSPTRWSSTRIYSVGISKLSITQDSFITGRWLQAGASMHKQGSGLETRDRWCDSVCVNECGGTSWDLGGHERVAEVRSAECDNWVGLERDLDVALPVVAGGGRHVPAGHQTATRTWGSVTRRDGVTPCTVSQLELTQTCLRKCPTWALTGDGQPRAAPPSSNRV